MNRNTIESLLAPESIAIVGASPDSWYSSNLIDNLIEYGYDGSIYYVNPNRDEVWDETCYDTITDIPTVVDLAVVSVPRQYVTETVHAAGEMGVPSALVITAGFGEADAEGEAFEVELGEIREEHDMAICGPNTIGFANMHDEITVTSTCSRKPGKGSIGLVSQSGALAFTTFYERAADEDLDFAYIIATGNETNLSITDYVGYLSQDDRVDVICAYIEGVDDPRRFMKVAADAIHNGTPVLAAKIGRSDVAEQATLSHTGSVTGDNAAWEAVFQQTGIERVPDIPDLLHRSRAHTAFDASDSARVCVASTSGGMASLLADMAADRDIVLPDIDGETEQALLDMEDLLTFDELHNPADIRGYGADILPEIAETVFADDTFDIYVFAVGLPAVGERAEQIAGDILTVKEMADDPVLFLWTGRKDPQAGDEPPLPYERVRQATPLYYDPGKCMDAAASLVRFGEYKSANRAGNNGTSYEMADLSADGFLPTESILIWSEAENLLLAAGIEPIDTYLTTSVEEARIRAETIGDEVVMKIDSRDIPHRTDAGAIAVGVEPDEVGERYSKISENVHEYAPQAEIEGTLIQERADLDRAIEVLVGVSRDESFGPVVTVVPGGVFVELFDENAGATFVPPISEEIARKGIESSKLGDLLSGYRGRPPSDLDALSTLVSQISHLVTVQDSPRIEELDLNPVLVNPDGDGVSVVDVLVRTGPEN